MTRKGAHRRRASGAALSLAIVAVIMVLVAVAAVFAPATNGKAGTALPLRGGVAQFVHPHTYPPGTASASPVAATSPTSASPLPSTPPMAVPRTYPAPVAAPAPAPRTYPAPPARTYPAPSPRTYTAPAPSPPPDPGADLGSVVPLTPPLAGVATADVAGWDAMTQSRAQLAVRYVSMAKPLAPSFVHAAMRTSAGAVPVIEITPTAPGQPALSLKAITAGDADGWLTALRDQIRLLHRPVVISFAPEANGHWYAWGGDPAGFVAAWRHVHAIIGGSQWWVTWMWQVSARNANDPATDDFTPYWPGGDVVDWVGLDGYYYQARDTFQSKFGASLAEVQRIWGGPVLIGETGVAPVDVLGATTPPDRMAAGIADLFAGVASRGLLGLIYFDLPPACPPQCGRFHPDVRLDGQPAALAAYTKAVNGQW